MASIRMRLPDGSMADVPAERLAEAKADGLVEIHKMALPDGSIADVPSNKLEEAKADGLKLISSQEYETTVKPKEENRKRLETAPRTVGGALFDSLKEGSFQPLKNMRDRNAAEGDELMARTNARMKTDPKMSFGEAYEKEGGTYNTGTPPLAITGAGAVGSVMSRMGIGQKNKLYSLTDTKFPVVQKAGEVMGEGIKGGARAAWSGLKKTVGGALALGGALGANALVEKAFGVNPIKAAVGDLTGTSTGQK